MRSNSSRRPDNPAISKPFAGSIPRCRIANGHPRRLPPVRLAKIRPPLPGGPPRPARQGLRTVLLGGASRARLRESRPCPEIRPSRGRDWMRPGASDRHHPCGVRLDPDSTFEHSRDLGERPRRSLRDDLSQNHPLLLEEIPRTPTGRHVSRPRACGVSGGYGKRSCRLRHVRASQLFTNSERGSQRAARGSPSSGISCAPSGGACGNRDPASGAGRPGLSEVLILPRQLLGYHLAVVGRSGSESTAPPREIGHLRVKPCVKNRAPPMPARAPTYARKLLD